MADVADDGAVLHLPHVVEGDDVDIAGRGDEDVAHRGGLVHRRHLIPLHRRLQDADRGRSRVTMTRAPWLRRLAAEPLPTSPNPATTATLAGHHHVGGALDAVDQALAAAVEIVRISTW